MDTTSDAFLRVMIPILTSIVSLLIYIIFEKFKNRVSIFTYEKSFNAIATSIEDNRFGSIKVLYNDNRIVRHLNLITLKIKNTSNTDFENVVVKCWVSVDS